MSKVLTASGVLCAVAAAAFVWQGTNRAVSGIDETLKLVPSSQRAIVKDLARNNHCDLLKAELAGPCGEARKLMQNSYFTFAFGR